jgi:hypothetical protein
MQDIKINNCVIELGRKNLTISQKQISGGILCKAAEANHTSKNRHQI